MQSGPIVSISGKGTWPVPSARLDEASEVSPRARRASRSVLGGRGLRLPWPLGCAPWPRRRALLRGSRLTSDGADLAEVSAASEPASPKGASEDNPSPPGRGGTPAATSGPARVLTSPWERALPSSLCSQGPLRGGSPAGGACGCPISRAKGSRNPNAALDQGWSGLRVLPPAGPLLGVPCASWTGLILARALQSQAGETPPLPGAPARPRLTSRSCLPPTPRRLLCSPRGPSSPAASSMTSPSGFHRLGVTVRQGSPSAEPTPRDWKQLCRRTSAVPGSCHVYDAVGRSSGPRWAVSTPSALEQGPPPTQRDPQDEG